MEIIVQGIHWLLLLMLIAFPIFLLLYFKNASKVKRLVAFTCFSLVFSALLILLSAWWGYFANELLLLHYGYEFDPMSSFDRLSNVSDENIERVKSLVVSNKGIG